MEITNFINNMKNLIALFGAFFAAKKSRFGCLGTAVVCILVYYLFKKIL
jgi:hypothetical protein